LIWTLKSQQLIANYLDLILYSLNYDELNHWGYSILEVKKNQILEEFDYANYLVSYNNFLKINLMRPESEEVLKWEFVIFF
jgi:hypothetical protein